MRGNVYWVVEMSISTSKTPETDIPALDCHNPESSFLIMFHHIPLLSNRSRLIVAGKGTMMFGHCQPWGESDFVFMCIP